MSDGLLVVQSNNEGVPFVLASPDARHQQGRHAGRRRTAACRAGRRPPPGGPEIDGGSDAADRGLRLRVGGLTVLREVVRRLPAESTVYLGDNARAPYGVRSDEEVLAFSTQSLDRLVERDVKAIVVACNTSTAVAIGALRRRYDLPILGVIRPGASAAALATRNRRVGVIATPATIRSHAYFGAIKDENPAVEVYEHATPTLVPLVEAGELSGPKATATVAEALAPLLGERDAAGESIFPRPPGATIDTLLLGCTHYPLLRPVIEALVGERVAIVDSATATASALAELLDINGLQVDGSDGASGATATHLQLTTGDPDSFHALASRLFGSAFPDVEHVELAVADQVSGRPGRSTAGRPGATTASGRRDSCIGSALGAAAVVAGRRAEQVARARPGRLAGGRAYRDRPVASGPRRPEPGGAARRGARVRRGDGPDRAGAVGGARERAAGRRRALWRGGPCGLGTRQHRVVRVAHEQAREGPARPGHAARRGTGQGHDGTRQPLGHHPPAWLPARVHGQPRPGPVRPRAPLGRGGTRPPALRRGEHPRRRPGRWACRSARSAPGSRCTRRPMPSSSRRTPGCGPTSRNGSSAS